MFQLTEVRPSVYLLEFKEHKDLISHFLRWQEIYESPNPNFKGRPFQLIDYIEWYSYKFGKGNFTYYNDWGGFNLPVSIILEHYPHLQDRNDRDDFMHSVAKYVERQAGQRTYLIGCTTGSSRILEHEIAHGLYYCDSHYREAAEQLVAEMRPRTRQLLAKTLLAKGYCEEVLCDETQAYMATGTAGLKVKVPLKERRPFIALFQSWSNSKSAKKSHQNE